MTAGFRLAPPVRELACMLLAEAKPREGIGIMNLTYPLSVRSALAMVLLASLALTGCSDLPASGPTQTDILNGETAPQNTIGFKIVNLDANAIRAMTSASPEANNTLPPAPGPSPALGRIGIGDILAISIFEVGNSLFNPVSAAPTETTQPGAAPSGAASVTNLPPQQVSTDGTIDIPYAAHLLAAGKTPTELAENIQAALAGQSQNPQVIVSITSNFSNTAVVSGDVHTPGRISLTLQPQRIDDIIALAGGANHPEEDTVVQLTRDGQTTSNTLSAIYEDTNLDPYIQPGDRIHLIFQPRSYTVFGAAGEVEQVTLSVPNVTLADALAHAGGPKDDQADPKAVFIFRFESQAVARGLGLAATGSKVPVIYQLDMMQPTSYFVEQEFAIRDQDVLYIGNARTDKVEKFFGLIGTLFSPAPVIGAVAK